MNGWTSFIARLDSISPVTERKVVAGIRTSVLTRSGALYLIRRLTDPNDPSVSESHCLIKHFDPSAVDSIETIRTAMRGVVVGDETTEDVPLLVHVIEDRSGRTVGTAHSAVVPFRDARGKDSKIRGFLLDAYEFIEPSARGQGLGTELWRMRLLDAAIHASERGLILEAIVAEAPSGAEQYLNRIGLRRCFLEDEVGRLAEPPYRQLVLADDWNKVTGQPNAGKQPTPFHLMVGLRELRTATNAEVLQEIIRAIIGYDSEQTPDYFENQPAYEAHLAIIERDRAEMMSMLTRTRSGRVILLPAEERKTWRSQFGPESVVEHQVERMKEGGIGHGTNGS